MSLVGRHNSWEGEEAAVKEVGSDVVHIWPSHRLLAPNINEERLVGTILVIEALPMDDDGGGQVPAKPPGNGGSCGT